MLVGVGPDLPDGVEGVAVGSDAPWDLAGWTVGDGEGELRLPPLHLDAGQALWLASNATSWQALGGPEPVLAWDSRSSFQLANGGEGIELRGPDGQTVDSFAWGDGTAPEFQGSLRHRSDALLYLRDTAWPDSDGPADWQTPRLHRIGESHLPMRSFEVANLTLYSSPDSTHDVLRQLIGGARERLHVHVYEFHSLDLAHRLAQAKRAHPGIDLQVLVDSQPVGFGAQERHRETQALQEIQVAGGHVVLSGHGRYNYHHLKVLVADDAVAVQSENWVESGVPRDPSAGNRGWGAVAHDGALADWMAQWMQGDRNAWDAQPFVASTFDPLFEPASETAPRRGDYGPVVAAREFAGPVRVTPIVSPDHTSDPRADPLVAVLEGAQRSISVQQLDLSVTASNPLGWHSPDPLLDALARAATRGVEVRVQAAAPFSQTDTGNERAIAWLKERGIHAQVMDRAGISTLHNKGIVVDDRIVVVGSMNANHHSRSANREVAFVLEGPGVAAHHQALFDADWTGATAGPDTSVVGRDVRGLPGAPLPSLLVLAGVGAAIQARRRP